MDILSAAGAALDLGTGGVVGGVTGLISGGVKMYKEYKTAQLEQQDRADQRKFDLERMDREYKLKQQELDSGERIAGINATAATTQEQSRTDATIGAALEATNQAIVGSMADDAAKDKDLKYPYLRFIEGARRGVRPFSAYYSWFSITVATIMIFVLYFGGTDAAAVAQAGKFTTDQVFKLMVYCLQVVFFISTQCITHYFIVRDAKRPVFPPL